MRERERERERTCLLSRGGRGEKESEATSLHFVLNRFQLSRERELEHNGEIVYARVYSVRRGEWESFSLLYNLACF